MAKEARIAGALRDRLVDQATGYLGLFLIGALGWAYEHFGRTQAAGRPVAYSPQPQSATRRS